LRAAARVNSAAAWARGAGHRESSDCAATESGHNSSAGGDGGHGILKWRRFNRPYGTRSRLGSRFPGTSLRGFGRVLRGKFGGRLCALLRVLIRRRRGHEEPGTARHGRFRQGTGGRTDRAATCCAPTNRTRQKADPFPQDHPRRRRCASQRMITLRLSLGDEALCRYGQRRELLCERRRRARHPEVTKIQSSLRDLVSLGFPFSRHFAPRLWTRPTGKIWRATLRAPARVNSAAACARRDLRVRFLLLGAHDCLDTGAGYSMQFQ
jgi:hypothetical protein